MPEVKSNSMFDGIDSNIDLNLYYSGTECCKPGHYWGPLVRDHFLIHYITAGKGLFQVNGRTYHLEKGEGFLIVPNVISYYRADYEDPWTYSWVGFNGLKAEAYLKRARLSLENPVLKYHRDDLLEKCLQEMLETEKLKGSKEIKLISLLYLMFAYLIEIASLKQPPVNQENLKETYIRRTIEYMQHNYSRDISITEIARHIGLDRKYLATIFKERLDLSPRDFLIHFRMNKACELMKNHLLSIGDISRSVGYEDPLCFSKIFKKIKGQSPREFRRSVIKNDYIRRDYDA